MSLLVLFDNHAIDETVRTITIEPVDTVYQALYQKLKTLDVKVVNSVYHHTGGYPYVTIQKVSNVLDTYSTCFTRLEDSLFQILCASNNFEELDRVIQDVEGILDHSNLDLNNRRFTNILWNRRGIFEAEQGFYTGQIDYEATVEKTLSSSLDLRTSSGTTFYEALVNLYKQSRLPTYVNDFIVTKFGKKRPQITIPNFNAVELFATTCSRIEVFNFEMVVELLDSPFQLETILDEIDNTFSSARLILQRKRFTHLEWLSDSLVEIEPKIWQGKVQFELMLEKDIT